MKTSEIRGKSAADLLEMIGDLKHEMFRKRFAATTEPIDNPAAIEQKRRDIARIKTILRERELELDPSSRKQRGRKRRASGN